MGGMPEVSGSASVSPDPVLPSQPVPTARARLVTTMKRSAALIRGLDRGRGSHSKVWSNSSRFGRTVAMMAGRALWLVVPSILPLAVGGCADKLLDGPGSASTGQACALEGEDDCGEGLACEPVLGSEDEHVCAERVEIHGRVIDALSQGPLEGALVVAADEVGAPVTTVVATDADGRYVLPVSVGRDAAGELAEDPRWTLLVSAADHLSFPGALRPALPLGVEEGAAI